MVNSDHNRDFYKGERRGSALLRLCYRSTIAAAPRFHILNKGSTIYSDSGGVPLRVAVPSPLSLQLSQVRSEMEGILHVIAICARLPPGKTPPLELNVAVLVSPAVKLTAVGPMRVAEVEQVTKGNICCDALPREFVASML